jgi:hypothetical protein
MLILVFVFWVVTPWGLANIPSLSSMLKIEVVWPSERLVSTYKFTQRYSSEDQHRHLPCRENLRSRIQIITLLVIIVNCNKCNDNIHSFFATVYKEQLFAQSRRFAP